MGEIVATIGLMDQILTVSNATILMESNSLVSIIWISEKLGQVSIHEELVTVLDGNLKSDR